jgi:hypothetical protein
VYTIYLFNKLRQNGHYNEKVVDVWRYLSRFIERVLSIS